MMVGFHLYPKIVQQDDHSQPEKFIHDVELWSLHCWFTRLLYMEKSLQHRNAAHVELQIRENEH
jgi:hypothetical protein